MALASKLRSSGAHLLLAVAVLMLVALLAAGCDGDEDEDEVSISGDEIPALVAAFDEADHESLAVIEDMVALGPAAIPMLVSLAEEPGLEERFAAAAVLGRIALEPDESQTVREQALLVLRFLTSDESPTVRAVAAGALAALGEIDALPVLMDLLATDERTRFMEPRERIKDFSI